MKRRTSSASLVESFVAAMMLLVCVSTLAAQSNKKDGDSSVRTLQGTVFDPDGTPVQQAVVQLKDTRTLQILSFITKEDGGYHFANLKTDVEYEVKAGHGGLATDWKRISVFDTRKVVIVNLKLEKK